MRKSLEERPLIVVCDGMDSRAFATFQNHPGLEVHPQDKVTAGELEKLLPRVQGLVVRSATRVDGDLLEKAPQLQYIVRAGEGTDNIDKAQCAARGIKVSNTPGANHNAAAEHTIALMLTVLRKTAWAHATMAGGGWGKSQGMGSELWKKKVGFVGFGRIGQLVAQRLAGFSPQIFFYDPSKEAGQLLPDAKKVSHLRDIFSSCDLVTLHAPLNSSTRGLIDRPLLENMLPHSILINVSRGGIVNEAALYDILSQGKIRGAGFDVFETEPLSPENPLRKLPHLVMTPHLGASTVEAQFKVGQMAVEQMEAFFLYRQLQNEVKP